MRDFDVSDPPRYRIGLFGHRASGKSVFVIALGAPRRPETDGTTVNFVEALEPENPDDGRSARELGREYAEVLAALQDGRLPAQTNPLHGNLRYAFDLLDPGKGDAADQFIARRRRLEISDHAGELVNRLTNEAERAALLRAFLAERDALILVAEAPRPGDVSEARQRAMGYVTSLSSRLAEVLKDQPIESLRCRTVVLLVTKWDRVHSFDGLQRTDENADAFLQRLADEEARHDLLFDAWMQTAEAAEHRQLLHDLQMRFGAQAVRAYPVTAFGMTKGTPNPEISELEEVPAGLPLATLNLVRPLGFLVEQVDVQVRAALLRRGAEDDPGSAWQVWRLYERLRSRFPQLPTAPQVRPRFGNDPELRKTLDAAHRRRGSSLGAQVAAALASGLLVLIGASAAIGVWSANQQRATAEAALATPALDALIAADQKLAQRPASSLFQPWLAAQQLVLDEEALKELRARIEAAECAQWEPAARDALARGERDPIEQFEERVREAPRCADVVQLVRRSEAQERLAGIDQLLNDYEFVRAIEQIFEIVLETSPPPEGLRDRLSGIDVRFQTWATLRDREPATVKERLTQVLAALSPSARSLADDVLSLQGRLQQLMDEVDLQIACNEFRDLRSKAVELARAPGGWPSRDSINSLLSNIGAWNARERSEFLRATDALRTHAEGLKRLQITAAETTGTLVDALGVSDATLTVTIGTSQGSNTIDTNRPGEQQLATTLRLVTPYSAELTGVPQLLVDLRESGIIRERVWSGGLGVRAPANWDAGRSSNWTFDITLLSDRKPPTDGTIKVELVIAVPPEPPPAASLPSVCTP